MSTVAAVSHIFGMNAWGMGVNLAGITHEESLVRAVPDGSHINWVVGHITQTRCRVLPAFGQKAPLPIDVVKSYGRGLSDESIILPLSELIAAFEESQKLLTAGLADATDDILDKPAPFSPTSNPDEKFGPLLLTCVMHESYHLGQIGILRRLVGKPGAIRTPPGLL